MQRVIYGLSRPGEDVRYVGFTTKGADSRLMTHFDNAARGKVGAVYDWIRKDSNVVVRVIEDCGKKSTLKTLQDRERWWIAYLKTELVHGGLNMTPGGSGGWEKGKKRTQECREAQSRYHQTPEGKERAVLRGKKSWESEERRAAHSAQMKTPEMVSKMDKSRHVRWHTNRQIVKDGCVWCQGE